MDRQGTGYEIMPMEMEQEIDIEDAIECCRQMNNPIVDLIINKHQTNNDCWRMFYSLHQKRTDKDHMGLLGVAKLARAHRDACADLLRDIARLEG
jgi:hypothetical protein